MEIHLFSKNTQTLSQSLAQKDTGDHGWEELMKWRSENPGRTLFLGLHWPGAASDPAEAVCFACPGLKMANCSNAGLEVQTLLPRMEILD